MRNYYVFPQSGQADRLLEAFPQASVLAPSRRDKIDTDALIWILVESPADFDLISDFSGAPVAPRIIVLSNTPGPEQALQAFRSGAHGYCHAKSAAELFHQVAAVVRNGGVWVSSEFMPHLLQGVGSALDTTTPGLADASDPVDIELLTTREREVVEQVCKGLTNKEVARQLNITERTVKAHMSAALEKLGMRDRVQLVIRLKSRLT